MILFKLLLRSIFPLSLMACKMNEICPVTRILSENQNKQLGEELRDMLGLPKRPDTIPKQNMKYSTKFLLGLYRELNEDNNRIKRDVNFHIRLRNDEVNKAGLSDVIVSLNSVNKKSDGVGIRQKLSFYLENMPSSTSLNGAELKLYQNSKLTQKLPFSMYKISIYHPSIFDNSKFKKIAEKTTSSDFTGWLSIDISYTFNRWLENITPVKDLYITVKPYGIINEKSIHPASLGIMFPHKQNENEPFIVAFLKAENKINRRVQRDIVLQPDKMAFFKVLEKNSACNIHSLRIEFKNLGWNDWIIAPQGYTSAFCHGSCNFPLKYPVETTNHALIQSLMQLKHPEKFPKPSCAPTKLNSLSVIYRGKQNTLLKKYKDLIPASCGCQ